MGYQAVQQLAPDLQLVLAGRNLHAQRQAAYAIDNLAELVQ